METMLKEGRKFSGKMLQNSYINCISSKQNYKKYLNKLHTVLMTHTQWL